MDPPPSALQQMVRTCALNEALLAHLHTKGMLNFAHKSIRQTVEAWYRTHGADLMCAAGLDPQEFSVHHVIPEAQGGSDIIFNLHLMPTSANSHFQDRWDTEKKLYIGNRQVNLATSCAKFVATQNIDWSPFNKNYTQYV